MATFSGLGAPALANPLILQLGPVVATALVDRFQSFNVGGGSYTRPVVYRPTAAGIGTATYSSDFYSPGQTAANPFVSSFTTSPSLPVMPAVSSTFQQVFVDFQLPRGSEIVVLPELSWQPASIVLYTNVSGSTAQVKGAIFWEEP